MPRPSPIREFDGWQVYAADEDQLWRCRNCGRWVAIDVDRCPECGCDGPPMPAPANV